MKTIKVTTLRLDQLDEFLAKVKEAIVEATEEDDEISPDEKENRIEAENEVITSIKAIAERRDLCPACLLNAVGYRAQQSGEVDHFGEDEDEADQEVPSTATIQ